MDPLSFYLYRTLGALALGPALALPVIKGRFGTRWNDRLGYTLCGGGRPLWLHGASVGEAGSSLRLLSTLRELGYLGPALLTATTPAALNYLESQIHNPTQTASHSGQSLLACQTQVQTQIAAQPLDFLGAPSRFLDRLAPRALLVIETEIWPELFYQCHKRSIPVLLLSARLSHRSHRRLSLVKGFISPILEKLSLTATISQADYYRLIDLGVSKAKAAVIGSPKFDGLIDRAQKQLATLSSEYKLDLSDQNNWTKIPLPKPSSQKFLILAGSTHPGEEELILSAISDLPNPGAVLALAPRHLVRVPKILDLIKKRGLHPILFSESGSIRSNQDSSVVVIDQIGLLTSLYQQCDLALVGGSFFEGDGHNPLEPAAAGKPIIFGPYMSSFKAEAEDLESLGAATAAPKGLLSKAIYNFLSNPTLAFMAGLSGLWYLSQRKTIAPILAQAVLTFLSDPDHYSQTKALECLNSQTETYNSHFQNS